MIWKKILPKSGKNSWKTPAKEPTLQQSYRLEAHPPRILPISSIIIYHYFKKLRTNFIPEYFSMVASLHYAFFLL